MVSTTVDSFSLPVAATLLGIRGASQSGIIRSALALFHGYDRVDAAKFASPNSKVNDAAEGRKRIVAEIPNELAVTDNPAWAIRVGLGMAMGLTRAHAEQWARIEMGRPRKQPQTETTIA